MPRSWRLPRATDCLSQDQDMKSIELTQEKVITMGDLAAAAQADTAELLVGESAVLTPSALEFLEQRKIVVRRGGKLPAAGKAASASSSAIEALFTSPEAEAIKEEICNVGGKLWQREYWGGNGGKILYRDRPDGGNGPPTLVGK